MNIVLTHRHYNNEHLSEVIEEMKSIGAPTIRAFWSELYGSYLAVEGCHRVRAAAELGIAPIVTTVEPTGEITIEVDGADETVDAEELFSQLQNGAAMSVDFDFDE